MIKEIDFKGLSLTPDDHHVQPGELSVCANLELHNGALRPSVVNGTTTTALIDDWEDNVTLLYVHKGSGYTHLIGSVTNNLDRENTGTALPYKRLVWFEEDGTYGDGIVVLASSTTEVYSILSVGNTLIALTSDGPMYAKWEGNEYTYIGSHIPECNLSFGLQGRYFIEHNDRFNVNLTNLSSYSIGTNFEDIIGGNFTKESITDITEQVLSHVNKFITNHHDKGKFMFPFFVRYAYRLYDGSLIMHSAPVLMICNTGCLPYVFADTSGSNNTAFTSCTVRAGLFDLDYKLLDASLINELKKWSDIIKSVDVFVSKPFYRYDASGKVKSVNSWAWDNEITGQYCVAKVTEGISGETDANTYPIGDFGNRYQRHAMKAFTYYGRKEYGHYVFQLPTKRDAVFNAEIRENSNFFLLASINPELLATERTVINLKEGFYGSIKEEEVNLGTIYTRELMSDDYESHDTIIPQTGFVYNSRLSVGQILRKLYDGYIPGAQFPFTDGLILPATSLVDGKVAPDDTYDVANDYNSYIQITYLINEKGRKIAVTSPEFMFGYLMPLPYLYYPNTHAYKAIIRRRKVVSDLIQDVKYCEVPLEPHPLLNGAVYFKGFDHEDPEAYVSTRPGLDGADTVDTSIAIPNKLYVSEVNNPFYFPVENIVTVGIGSIIGLASTTRALSQGQFGQYPLIAFCTDGVWALDVSASGTFSSIHPISREICVNADSICQLDQSVLFATERGISQVVESSVVSISDILDGPLFNISVLGSELQTIAALYSSALTDLASFTTHPITFFKTAKLVYDFINARVLALSTSSRYAFVYSLRDNAWSITDIGFTPLAAVAGYPYPYIQKSTGEVMHLDSNYNYGDTTRVPGMVITRILSFSSLMQVIQGFQQLHNCPSANNPRLVIYGSNDGINWKYVGNSNRAHAPYLPGHPYRYFRIAVLVSMLPKESYSRLLLDVIEKYQKL